MGYRIDYDTHVGKFEIRADRPKRNTWLYTLAAFLLFLVLTFSFWEAGAEKIRNVLIPGDDTLTMHALNSLSENLRQGTPVLEAVESFCVEIIHGTQTGN